MTDGPYARLYLALVDDPKFAGIYGDDRHFATWCRLLMIAEPAWPSSAHLPRSARAASLRALADAELIDLLPGDRYRIHGLDAERASRHEHAKKASNARWNAPSIAPSNAQPMPSQDRVQDRVQAEHSARATDDPVVAYAELAGGYPSPKAMDWIDGLTEEYGHAAVIKALAIGRKGGATGIIGRAKDHLRAEARALSVAEAEAEKAKVHAHRLGGMYARRLEWFRQTGKWEDGWGPRPEAA